MPNALSASGLTIASVTEVFNNLVTGYQGIYGTDINVAANSPDGQALMILAEAIVDNLELLLQVYNSFIPESAFGTVLDQRVSINGIQRKAGTYTQVYIQVTVSAAVTIPGLDVLVANPGAVVFTVADGAGNQYELVQSYAFGSTGSAVLLFEAVNIGQVQTTPNSITSIATPLLYVTTVNNPNTSISFNGATHAGTTTIDGISSTAGLLPGMGVSDGNVSIPQGTTIVSVATNSIVVSAQSTGSTGSDNITAAVIAYIEGLPEETDQQLKIRRVNSFFLQAVGPADATRAQLLQFADISDALVIENDTGSTVNGVPAHSLYCIVNGGTSAEITQAIYATKAPGCGLFGSKSGTLTRPQGNTFQAFWDVAVSQPLYIRATLNPRNGSQGFNTAGDAIALAATLIYKLGQSPSINDVILAMAVIEPNAVMSVVNVSVDGSTWELIASPTSYVNYFVATATNINLVNA